MVPVPRLADGRWRIGADFPTMSQRKRRGEAMKESEKGGKTWWQRRDLSKWHSKSWKLTHLLTLLTCLALAGVFYQPLRVYAFDIQQAIDKQPHVSIPKAQSQSTSGPEKANDQTSSLDKSDRWSSGDVVSALSSFYQSIIALLGLMLALVGVLAVITLRFLSKAAAEDMAHDSAKTAFDHYLKTKQFEKEVFLAVQESDISDQLEKLAKDKEALDSQVQQLMRDKDDLNKKLEEVTSEIGKVKNAVENISVQPRPSESQAQQPPEQTQSSSQSEIVPPTGDNEDIEGTVVVAPSPDGEESNGNRP